jgi:UDP-N-acetylglucosamine:LPS N-acetylglucosamine transferase
VPRVLLVSSSGGVLPDLLALRPWWGQYDTSWVAVDAPDTRELLARERVRWTAELSPGRPDRVLAAVPAARAVLTGERVDLVVSAGTGVAVPWFLAARTAGVRAVWVETFNIVDRAGLAARLCARLAGEVVVQRPHLLARHRRAVNLGELW